MQTIHQGEVARDAALFSELITLHACLGKGYNPPLDNYATPGMLFTSAVHPAVFDNLKRAEAAFVERHVKRQEDSAELLEELERSLSPTGLSVMSPDHAKKVRSRIKDLKKELSRLPCATWSEHSAHKSTLLELLGRTAYGSLTLMDTHGSRIAAAVSNGYMMLAEASFLSLTDSLVSDSAFIRSSNTGGATIHALSGSDRPVFSYVSQVHTSVTQALASKLQARATAVAGLAGHAVVVPVRHGDTPALSITRDVIFKRMCHTFALGAEPVDKRLELRFDNLPTSALWRSFLDSGYTEFTGKPASDHALEKTYSMPASFRTMTAFATKAAFTYAILSAPVESEFVLITADHLQMAEKFAAMLFVVSSGLSFLETRADNAAKAREAKAAKAADPSLTSAACEGLRALIQASPRRMVSRKQAGSVAGMTLSKLDHLVATGQFVELLGTDTIRMGATNRAYILKADAAMDPEEAMLELEDAFTEFCNDPGATDPGDAENVLKELQAMAEVNNRTDVLMVPAVPITRMTTRQIRCLPYIDDQWSTEAYLRGTRERPEPPHLLRSAQDPEAPMEPGVPNLWLRADTRGKPFRDWNISKRLGFAGLWGEEQ